MEKPPENKVAKLLLPFLAFYKGAQLCLTVKEVRNLAIKPWIIGIVSWILSAFLAIYFHGTILHSVVAEPNGIKASIFYYLVWMGIAVLLLIVSLIFCAAMVMVFASLFQEEIAKEVLLISGVSLELHENSGIKENLTETSRIIYWQIAKLLLLLPLIITVFIFGLIPFFMPGAVLLGSWLLAYQFIDVPLELQREKVSQRIKFALKHFLTFSLYGLILTILWPTAGWLLPPIACAGATWLVSDVKDYVNKE